MTEFSVLRVAKSLITDGETDHLPGLCTFEFETHYFKKENNEKEMENCLLVIFVVVVVLPLAFGRSEAIAD